VSTKVLILPSTLKETLDPKVSITCILALPLPILHLRYTTPSDKSTVLYLTGTVIIATPELLAVTKPLTIPFGSWEFSGSQDSSEFV
jgi:hypothetical protein